MKKYNMTVDQRFIKETIAAYNKSSQRLNETDDGLYATEEINGGMHKVVDMSLSEFTKINKAVNMNDIKWT